MNFSTFSNILALEGKPNFVAIGVIGGIAVIAAIIVIVKIAYNKGVEEAFEEESVPIKRTPPKKRKPREHTSSDDGAVIAAITAAVSMMLAAEGKDPSGFRVVSFKRSKK